MHVTFHRALDKCRDPGRAVRDLRDLGVTRILTSEQAVSAMAGTGLIRDLQNEFPDMIFIAAGGVIPSNVTEIIAETGVREVHASAKTTVKSGMKFRRVDVSMGNVGMDEYMHQTSDTETIRKIVAKL